MTEAEWSAPADPLPMLESLGKTASGRKIRLFAVACCWSMLVRVEVNSCDLDAVTAAERHADGLLDDNELDEAADRAGAHCTAAFACRDAARTQGWFARRDPDVMPDRFGVARHASADAAWAVADLSIPDGLDDGAPEHEVARVAELAVQADLVRCLFGNPFRPVAIDPGWLTPTVVALAAGIYADRAWDRLPVLADALDDAGCDHPDILSHCRTPGPHARGCWVVDLVLGKE